MAGDDKLSCSQVRRWWQKRRIKKFVRGLEMIKIELRITLKLSWIRRVGVIACEVTAIDQHRYGQGGGIGLILRHDKAIAETRRLRVRVCHGHGPPADRCRRPNRQVGCQLGSRGEGTARDGNPTAKATRRPALKVAPRDHYPRHRLPLPAAARRYSTHHRC